MGDLFFVVLMVLMTSIGVRAIYRGLYRLFKPRRFTPTRRRTKRRHSPRQTTRPARNTFDSATAQKTELPRDLLGRAYVVDGDTIKIKRCQIRLFGIDAPELNHPYGRKAKSALITLCMGQEIKAVVTEKDAYGRTVARCYLPDGRDLSAEMVKLGLAIDWPKFSGGIYRDMELPDVRRKLWLADARQKGRMHVWEQFEAKQSARQ